jgi:hypothetical protein
MGSQVDNGHGVAGEEKSQTCKDLDEAGCPGQGNPAREASPPANEWQIATHIATASGLHA